MLTCHCGSIPISLEARRPGINRGRWYFKCPTGTCNFFKWDESPYPFIRHPTEAYASAQPLNGQRMRPAFNYRQNSRDTGTSLTKNKVHVSFCVLSSSLIGIKTESNLTLDPVIEKIKDIQWSEKYGQWIIPASVTSYNIAIGSLPQELPNLQVEIDPIPTSLLDNMIEAALIEAHNDSVSRSGKLTEVETKWSEFVESPMHKLLGSSVLQKAVSTGIERGGRILIGNENGIGSIEPALALTKIYQEDWPALVICPTILCHSWKMEIMKTLSLREEQVTVVDPKLHRSVMFKQTYFVPRKRKNSNAESTKPKTRPTYKQKMKKRLETENYQSSSSEEDSEEDGEGSSQEENSQPVLFYIVDYELAVKRKKDILLQNFKTMVCADSHFLKAWAKGEIKTVGKLLQKSKRAILISPSARLALPSHLFISIQSIAPTTFPDFDAYAKRYCDSKSTVFGINNNGRSNRPEFEHMMENNIWYCPSLQELKRELPDFVKQVVPIKLKKNTELKRRVENLCKESEEYVNDLEIQTSLVKDLHKRTSELKKDFIPKYLEYINETFKRPKIAIAYYNLNVYQSIKEYFDGKKKKFNNLNVNEGSIELCKEYNKSNSVQFILLDMNVEDLSISLDSVDLVIFVELPFDMAKLSEFESFFKSKKRKGPLSIKYLTGIDTVDDYLWPVVKTF